MTSDYHLTINWPDEQEDRTEIYESFEQATKRIDYLRQLPYDERPKWTIVKQEPTSND